MKEIIVLGGGFAGVSAVHMLLQKLKGEDASITLIDQNSYHLFRASLYEVATHESTQKNIAIPLSEIFPEKINIVKAKVEEIDKEKYEVITSDGKIYHFDYLIVALGSVSASFGVEGVDANSLSLHWLEDAIQIRRKIENIFHQKVKHGKSLKIIVAGGGFTGTELASEFVNYKQRLSRHNKTDESLFEIFIIQGPHVLLKELDEKVSELAYKRLRGFGVNIILDSHVTEVEKDKLITDTGASFDFDLLIWTCGVRGNSVLVNSGFKTDGKGLIEVNEYMQVAGSDNIFSIGDNALFANPLNNKPVPQVAQVAEDQGKVAAENVVNSIKRDELVKYQFSHLGYIIPLKGRYAVAALEKFKIVGLLGWMIQQLVFLYYLLRILPLAKALKRWNRFEMYLNENI